MANMSEKHRLKVKQLRQTILDIRKGAFLYQQKEAKNIDFTKYNLAQINEITDVLESTRDSVDIVDRRIQRRTIPLKGPGRPKVPARDAVKVQIMETYFGAYDRVAEGFFNLLGKNSAYPLISATKP
jgi:hypothetical protein